MPKQKELEKNCKSKAEKNLEYYKKRKERQLLLNSQKLKKNTRSKSEINDKYYKKRKEKQQSLNEHFQPSQSSQLSDMHFSEFSSEQIQRYYISIKIKN